MPKPETADPEAARSAPKAARPATPGTGGDWIVSRNPRTGQIGNRIGAVMGAAERSGFTTVKDGRIGGRVSRKLIAAAKAHTGIETDTELLEFALANLALEDDFAAAFQSVRGTVDPELDLDF